jgi:uncharacterized RDD family membrane protein YckC
MDGQSTAGSPAGLPRRLAALCYDLVLALAVAAVATIAMLPITHGSAILTSTQGWVGHAYHAVVLAVVFAYFGWSWTRGGRTLGLMAWGLRLTAAGDRSLGWAAAAGRFALGAMIAWFAALGAWYLSRAAGALPEIAAATMLGPAVLNFAWVLVDPAGRSLQDLATGARIVRVR